MTYFAESNYIEYDLCFESNINTVNFINYSEENEFLILLIKNSKRYQVLI